jgi:hypothetical protein
MITFDITYTDFTDITHTDKAAFHLSKTEIAKLEFGHEGGLSTMLSKMLGAGNTTKVIPLFEQLVRMSYGIRSADMKHFVKTQESLEAFASSGACDEFVFSLIQDPDKARKFISGILPSDIRIDDKTLDEAMKKMTPPTPSGDPPSTDK